MGGAMVWRRFPNDCRDPPNDSPDPLNDGHKRSSAALYVIASKGGDEKMEHVKSCYDLYAVKLATV